MKKTILSFIIALLLQHAWAQQTVIRGSVRSTADNTPLAGISVMQDSVTATITDAQGNFSMAVKELPVSLVFSAAHFSETSVRVSSADAGIIYLEPVYIVGEQVVVGLTRSRIRYIDAPVSAEYVDAREIKNAPATSYYDIAAYKKGIDMTTSSMTFKTISTRGFNGSGSTRVNQLVDGMDNQAPGLNFFVGNFAGITELDVESIELLPGASSALYGPGGLNGTVLINSKNPFRHQGFSMLVKEGVNHVDRRQRASASMFHDFSMRYAKAFNDRFAFKLAAQYINASDWLAADSSNYRRSGSSGMVVPGNRRTDPNYDGVNVYGDETSVDLNNFLPFLPNTPVSRTGYHEADVIDPETRNIKLTGAVHYKLGASTEAILAGNWARGSTVYTGNNRYVLKGVTIGQYKAEIRNKHWFIRSYTTQEDAGEAYSATVAMQYMNEAWKRSFDPNNIAGSWYAQYATVFATALGSGASEEEAHAAAREVADMGRPEPGSVQFRQLFDSVRKRPISQGGGLFVEQSQLWMTEGQYTIPQIRFAEVMVGANWKRYILDSKGTLFIDTAGSPIRFGEIGGFAQVTKKIADRLTLSFAGRYDKNEDFSGRFTPRATALVKLVKDNNIRLSYQTAYRFPSTQQKYIRLNVGDYELLGGLPWIDEYMNAGKSPLVYLDDMTPYSYQELKPESGRSYEIGYKGVISEKLLLDAYYYRGSYTDFLGRRTLYQPDSGKIYSIVVNSPAKVKTDGFGFGADYRLVKGFSVFANVYSDRITDLPQGFQSYFNTPEFRVNAGITHTGIGKKKAFGYSVMGRWQDGFMWDGELANGPVKSFTTMDAQVNYHFSKVNSTVKLGATNLFNNYYKTGYGNPEVGGLYYVSFGIDLK